MVGDDIIVVCACGVRNRLPTDWVGELRCGTCQKPLPVEPRPGPAAPLDSPNSSSADGAPPRQGKKSGSRAFLVIVLLSVAAAGYWHFKSRLPTNAPEEIVSTNPQADCEQTDNPRLTIAGCTALIARPDGDPDKLARVYLLRGIAHVKLTRLAEGRADYDSSLQLVPANPGALEERGHLNEFEDRYEKALADFTSALAHVQAMSGPNPSEESVKRQESLQQSVARLGDRIELENRWRSYLGSIQNQDDYANWMGPPNDLYRSHNGVR